jgi:predicted HicB family RNase H-like nuclease
MQDNKTVSITFRTTKELKAALVLMAEKESRKLSNLIEMLLDKAVKAPKKG